MEYDLLRNFHCLFVYFFRGSETETETECGGVDDPSASSYLSSADHAWIATLQSRLLSMVMPCYFFFMLTDINVGRDRGPAQKQAGSVYINSCAHRTRVLASRDTSTGNTECLYRGGIVHMHGTFRGTSHTLCSLLHTRDVECVYDNNICSHSCLAYAIHHDSSIPPHDTDFIGVDNVRIE